MQISENRVIRNDTVFDINLSIEPFDAYCLSKLFNASSKIINDMPLTNSHKITYMQWYKAMAHKAYVRFSEIDIRLLKDKEDFCLNQFSGVFDSIRLVICESELLQTVDFLNLVQSPTYMKYILEYDLEPMLLADMTYSVRKLNTQIKGLINV